MSEGKKGQKDSVLTYNITSAKKKKLGNLEPFFIFLMFKKIITSQEKIFVDKESKV
jgi:hypothetical protein